VLLFFMLIAIVRSDF